MYNIINTQHKTLNDCFDLGTLYLDYFFLSLDTLEAMNIKLLTLDILKGLVKSKRDSYKTKHPAAKAKLGEFKDDRGKNLELDSLNSLARHLKGGRVVIRDYLKGDKSGYYWGKWKFSYQLYEIWHIKGMAG